MLNLNQRLTNTSKVTPKLLWGVWGPNARTHGVCNLLKTLFWRPKLTVCGLFVAQISRSRCGKAARLAQFFFRTRNSSWVYLLSMTLDLVLKLSLGQHVISWSFLILKRTLSRTELGVLLNWSAQFSSHRRIAWIWSDDLLTLDLEVKLDKPHDFLIRLMPNAVQEMTCWPRNYLTTRLIRPHFTDHSIWNFLSVVAIACAPL